jgi:hypothetical protein
MLKSRSTKIRNKHNYTAYNKPYLSFCSWKEWCYKEYNYKQFINLYNIWIQSGCNTKLRPSIDRIDNNIGYEYKNLQWLSRSQNSKKFNKNIKK